MRYDSRVDDAILKILCTQQKCSYLKLKRKVDYVFSKWRMNRRLSISFETFTFHLKTLVKIDMVKRREESIKKIKYLMEFKKRLDPIKIKFDTIYSYLSFGWLTC